jgi:ribosomal protein L11 methyltransferase
MSEKNEGAEARYPFVAVDASPDQSDEIAAALFELGAMGVEERDASTLVRGAGPDKVTLVGSFESIEAANEAIAALAEAVPEGNARLEEVVGDAWRDAWKQHFEPFALTPHITVVPPWHARPEMPPTMGPQAAPNPAPAEPAPAGTMILELEPGRAFGTGLHASTSLIAEMLDASRAALAGREVLDAGTGSGILAFVALLHGAKSAMAIDLDPDVIEVVNENAARNGLSDRVQARQGTVETITRAYPWVIANIEARVLKPIAAELARVTEPGGTLILSGILGSEHDEIVHLYTSLPKKLTHLETRRRGDAGGEAWVAIAFQAK